MFADHSLRSFPSVVAGLRALDRAGLDIVIMTRGQAEHSRDALAKLGLADVALVPGSPAVLALGCKAALAVLLLAAGGAKLADLGEFATTVALFLPRRPGREPGGRGPGGWGHSVALAIAAGEIVAGAASLAIPRAWWLNI